MLSRKTVKPEQSSLRLLLWTAIVGLIFGLIGFGELAEHLLRAGRNSLHVHKASGDIVVVKIDDASLREVGRWPWPRRYHAGLTDSLRAPGARRVLFVETIDVEPARQRHRQGRSVGCLPARPPGRGRVPIRPRHRSPVYIDVSLKPLGIVYPAAGSLNTSVEVEVERLFALVGDRWVDLCRLVESPGT